MRTNLGVFPSLRYVLITVLLAANTQAISQNKTLGIGTTTPNTNAALHVESPNGNQGFILPRLTTAQINNMANLPLTSADNGLMVFDNELKEIFLWKDVQWMRLAPVSSNIFEDTDLNSNTPALSAISNSNQTGGLAIEGIQRGTGDNAAQFVVENTDSEANAIVGTMLGRGNGVVGLHFGSSGSAINGAHLGSRGNAGYFMSNNPANDSSTIYAYKSTNFFVPAIKAVSDNAIALYGSGKATLTGYSIGVLGESYGNGIGVLGFMKGTNGFAGSFETTNPGNSDYALKGFTAGLGSAGYFQVDNVANVNPAVHAITNGTSGTAIKAESSGLFGIISTKTTSGWGLWSETSGTTGIAGRFLNINSGNPEPSLEAMTNGGGNAINASTQGLGKGIQLTINNTENTQAAVDINHMGTGYAIVANRPIQLTSSGGNTINATQNGPFGSSAIFSLNDGSNSSAAVNVINTGSGDGLRIDQTGVGAALRSVSTNNSGGGNYLQINNSSNSATGLSVSTNGLGGAANFQINNTTNNQPGLGVVTSGTGAAAQFIVSNATSGASALSTSTNGFGSALSLISSGDGSNTLIANHSGTTGNIAIFRNNGGNVARIDKTGQAFFNGGTVNSGADLAEAFEVEGAVSEYEPGDVLIISNEYNRRVVKCASPNSTAVIGVLATKPGVVLTDRNMDDSFDDTVPLGVIGVIPTKVTSENGPIKRGDLLVTSSTPGHAMKALPIIINNIAFYSSGIILGKALEDFSEERGIINVFVNVK